MVESVLPSPSFCSGFDQAGSGASQGRREDPILPRDAALHQGLDITSYKTGMPSVRNGIIMKVVKGNDKVPFLERIDMPEYKDLFLARAFRIVPGKDYNRVWIEMREKEGEELLIYEVVLKEDQTWEYWRDRVYPNLVRYLREKGKDPSEGEGFIVALFFQDRVYLIQGRDFFRVFCEMEGLNFAAFHFRVLRWLSESSSINP